MINTYSRVDPNEIKRWNELEKLVTNPVDPDYESWRASKYKYIVDRGKILRVPTIGGKSFTSSTNTETIYSNKSAGTAKNTFTTEVGINDTAGMGTQAKVPAAVWYDSTKNTATLRIAARGILSTTATPTYTWTTRANGGTAGSSNVGAIIGGTAGIVAGNAVSNKLWEMEWDIQTVTMAGAGNNSTLRCAGLLTSPGGLGVTTGAAFEIWGNAAQPGTVATVDVTIDNFIGFNVTSSASSASNGLTLLQFIIQGAN